MFFAEEPQTSRVYLLSQGQGLFIPSKPLVSTREIALHDKNVVFWGTKAPIHSQLGLLHGQRVLIVFCIV